MEFFQNADPGALVLVGVGLVFLCVVALLLLFGLQVVGSTLFNLIALLTTLVSGGPMMWCGCLVLLLACGLCGGGVLLYASCNANPASMNFCLLFAGGG
ncbi:MAG TPA: hypothetical protein VHO69_02795 [Phototrophicaceae bacterium]|nr:hypothetical protein [Phototrophicaceae bacterium]